MAGPNLQVDPASGFSPLGFPLPSQGGALCRLGKKDKAAPQGARDGDQNRLDHHFLLCGLEKERAPEVRLRSRARPPPSHDLSRPPRHSHPGQNQ